MPSALGPEPSVHGEAEGRDEENTGGSSITLLGNLMSNITQPLLSQASSS